MLVEGGEGVSKLLMMHCQFLTIRVMCVHKRVFVDAMFSNSSDSTANLVYSAGRTGMAPAIGSPNRH